MHLFANSCLRKESMRKIVQCVPWNISEQKSPEKWVKMERKKLNVASLVDDGGEKEARGLFGKTVFYFSWEVWR